MAGTAACDQGGRSPRVKATSQDGRWKQKTPGCPCDILDLLNQDKEPSTSGHLMMSKGNCLSYYKLGFYYELLNTYLTDNLLILCLQ